MEQRRPSGPARRQWPYRSGPAERLFVSVAASCSDGESQALRWGLPEDEEKGPADEQEGRSSLAACFGPSACASVSVGGLLLFFPPFYTPLRCVTCRKKRLPALKSPVRGHRATDISPTPPPRSPPSTTAEDLWISRLPDKLHAKKE